MQEPKSRRYPFIAYYIPRNTDLAPQRVRILECFGKCFSVQAIEPLQVHGLERPLAPGMRINLDPPDLQRRAPYWFTSGSAA